MTSEGGAYKDTVAGLGLGKLKPEDPLTSLRIFGNQTALEAALRRSNKKAVYYLS